MPIIVSDIKTGLDEGENAAVTRALALLALKKEDVCAARVTKVSVDARRKDEARLAWQVAVSLSAGERAFFEKLSPGVAAYRGETSYVIPELARAPETRPVLIGFGPAGMFAGLVLARAGARPVILERGAAVDERAAAVERYWRGGELDCASNVQFGEGGAGTFSDGKLTTRINDPRCDFILREFAAHGAPEEILYRAKPHIGTDMLRGVVKGIRDEIISLGGEVRFGAEATDIEVRDGAVRSVTVLGDRLPAQLVLMAVGHSARDTFAMLKGKGLVLTAKPFSVGARIEHLQAEVDRAQYGALAGHPALGRADYQFSLRDGERCVYTFCMCPGGEVVPAASEAETVVTNGMSRFARDARNANSALVCSVSAQDFAGDPFAAMEFQRGIEHAAYLLSGGKAPAQTVGSFLSGGPSRFGAVVPSYARGVAEADISALFPENINEMLRRGIRAFGGRMAGFSSPEAVLTAPETRTSSPIRIVRGEDMQALGALGLYPCAEGAGYAGGIMSAAADGIRAAEMMIEKLAER